MKFTSLNTPEFIVRALETKNIAECTEIQKEVIPLLSEDKDVIGQSKTGSGKTFAYAIPAAEKVDTESGDTQILVVCPTRELAAQVVNEIRFLNTFREGCKVVPVFGGTNMARQVTTLKKNAEIVVGTPGRLVDHLKRRTLKLENLKMLVLDEADEMLKMGFKEEVEKIISKCPDDRVTAMFSATMPDGVKKIAENYMRAPVVVEIDDEITRSVAQFYVKTGLKDKDSTLKKLIKRFSPERAMVFCNTKRMVEKLSASLSAIGVQASAIHGDMPQKERKAALDKLKSGEVSLMIATDVAARGIDVEGVDIVFNYDVPQTAEYYVHRIGRTGRADKKGVAYTLINTDWGMKCLSAIVAATGNTVEEFCFDEKQEKKQRRAASRQVEKSAKKYADEHVKPSFVRSGERLKGERDFIEQSARKDKKQGESKKYADVKKSGPEKYAAGKKRDKKEYPEKQTAKNYKTKKASGYSAKNSNKARNTKSKKQGGNNYGKR